MLSDSFRFGIETPELAHIEDDGAIRQARALVRVWDEAIRIPILGWRIGLDALVGLVPGVGDVVGAVVSSYLVVIAARLGVGTPTLVRMLANLGVDALVGAVPLAGDLFDAGWKANRRNYELLERWYREPRAVNRSSVLVIGSVVTALVALIGLVVWLSVIAIRTLVG